MRTAHVSRWQEVTEAWAKCKEGHVARMGKMRHDKKLQMKSVIGKDNLENLGADGMIIKKWNERKRCGTV
jgi:hypothetical protein